MGWRGLLPIVALVLAACTRERTESPQRVRWHEREEELGCVGLPRDHGEAPATHLPEAMHASGSGPAGRPQVGVVVTLPAAETIHFEGNTWSLRDSPERALASLRNEIRRSLEGTPAREPPPEPDATLELWIDAARRWTAVRPVLVFARSQEAAFAQLRFAVVGTGHWALECSGHLAAVWRGTDDPAATVLSIALERGVEGARAVVRLRAGERSWEFPRTDAQAPAAVPFRGADLAAANRVWDELEARLASDRGSGTTAASLRVGDEVPWAYVVAALDACIGARVFDVRLDGDLGLRLLPQKGPPVASPPGDREVRDWSVALALSVGAVAAVAVFALGRFANRRRERVRSSPAGKAPG